MHAPDGLGIAFTLLFAAQILPAGVFCLLRARARRDLVPAFALVGGALSALAEPLLDTLGYIWWPTNIPLTLYTAFGIEIPSYTAMGYCLFLGFGSYLVYERVRAGAGPATVWAIAAAFLCADLLYEIPFLNLGLYDYYGPQPLSVAGFPLFWPFLNASVVVVGGGLMIALCADDRPQAQRALGAVLAPVLAIGALLAAGWPVFLALHATLPAAIRAAVAAVTIALAVGEVAAIAGVARLRAAAGIA